MMQASYSSKVTAWIQRISRRLTGLPSWLSRKPEPFPLAKKTDRFFGCTLMEWAAERARELEIGEVGLWEITSQLQEGFEYIDNDLISMTRLCLLTLFWRGAKPVVAAKQGQYGWRLANYPGDTDEEKVESIIQEWLHSPEDPVFWNSVWFVLPQYITEPLKSNTPEHTNTIKLYPGTVYKFPLNGGYFGVRAGNRRQRMIDISHIPNYPPYIKLDS